VSNNLTEVKDTRFVAGVSGNPSGRPKGSKNKSTLLREAMEQKVDRKLSREIPQVLDVVIRAAKSGDMSAAKMLLDRAVPVQKATDGTDKSPISGLTIRIENLTAPQRDEKVIEGTTVKIGAIER
jgi:hypothetical protein